MPFKIIDLGTNGKPERRFLRGVPVYVVFRTFSKLFRIIDLSKNGTRQGARDMIQCTATSHANRGIMDLSFECR